MTDATGEELEEPVAIDRLVGKLDDYEVVEPEDEDE